MSDVRRATLDDIPAMLSMAKKFIGKAWDGTVPYNEKTCEKLLAGLTEVGILLITEDGLGMIGVAIHPWHFNEDVLTSTELFWWCEGKGGPQLREEAERLAKKAGAKSFNMGRMHGMRDAALDRLYRSKGFEPHEHIYIKELD